MTKKFNFFFWILAGFWQDFSKYFLWKFFVFSKIFFVFFFWKIFFYKLLPKNRILTGFFKISFLGVLLFSKFSFFLLFFLIFYLKNDKKWLCRILAGFLIIGFFKLAGIWQYPGKSWKILQKSWYPKNGSQEKGRILSFYIL